MKHFPFKILFLSILLPPICYLLSVQVLQGQLLKREESKVNRILIQNYDALYEGRHTVKEEVNDNLGRYLKESLNYRLGIRTNILVKTKDQQVLYPVEPTSNYLNPSIQSLNYVKIAADNYKILNDGLVLSVDLRIKYNGLLSYGIFAFYVLVFGLILQRFVKRGIRETEKEEKERSKLIGNLTANLKKAETRLREVERKEAEYLTRISKLNKDKRELSKDVDGLLDEMEKLEQGLGTQQDLKEEMELEVLQMREELARLKGKVTKSKRKKKEIEATGKRFKVLYKNLDFTERAVEGFSSLNDEFQLKAEEVIHRLNEDDSLVSVKRKVFGKGGKMNILEADFSYSGRLYFRKDTQPRITVMAIGTKNTQDQDLAYLENAR